MTIPSRRALLASGSSRPSGRRPPPARQLSLVPPLDFDPNVPEGDVHTVLPPEQVIPSYYDRDWWRGDAWGVMLDEAPPYVDGANTTPPEMVMSYFLPGYVQFGSKWVDKILTAHAKRNYSHFHFDQYTFEQFGLSDAQAADLMAYTQSWGFFTSYWAKRPSQALDGGNFTTTRHLYVPFLRTLLDRGLAKGGKLLYVVGEELNSGYRPGPNGLDDVIANMCDLLNPLDVPVWLHFTSNYPAFPVDTDFTGWWRPWVGRVKGLLWQADPYASAGLMGAKLWDARKYIGAASVALKVVAFELRGTAQLYGRCTEEQGCLTAWEMICCTRDQTPYPAVAGAGNGPRYPDGMYL